MSFKRDVIDRLDSITEQQIKHTTELALNTRTLVDHHVRTSQIEARVVPLEHSHIFFNKLSKAVASLLVAGAALASILKFLVFK